MKILNVNKDLKLKNDGKLEFVFIGTGTAFSTELGNNNLIIIKGDTHILVDFGVTAPFMLKDSTGLDVFDFECIFPTHSHSDHIGGLEFLTLQNRYIGMRQGKSKLKMIIPEEYKEILWEYSLRGGLQFNELAEDERKMKFADYYDFLIPEMIYNNDRKKYLIEVGGVKLEIFTTNHIPDVAESPKDAFITYGLYVDDRIFFSGDTKFDLNLINDYKDRSEILFHDCSFNPNPVHADLKSLRTLPDEIKQKMYLMHYSEDFEKYNIDDFAGLAKSGVRYIFD